MWRAELLVEHPDDRSGSVGSELDRGKGGVEVGRGRHHRSGRSAPAVSTSAADSGERDSRASPTTSRTPATASRARRRRHSDRCRRPPHRACGARRWSAGRGARARDDDMAGRQHPKLLCQAAAAKARSRGGSSGFIVAHPAEDLVTDAAAQGADRLGLGVALGASVLEVRLARALALELGDRDAVEGHVELAVAGPAQAVALGVARPDRQRRRAVVAGEGGPRAEPADPRRLADELGRRQRSAAREGQQRRGEVGDQAADLALERVDRRGQLADPGDQLTGDPGDRPGCPARCRSRRGQDDRPVEAAGCRLAARVELVEVPAQAVLGTGPLGDEVLAMVDQQADLAVGAVEGGDRQVLAERRPGDREGVDRIALAGLARSSGGRRPSAWAGRGRPLSPATSRSARQAPGEVAAVLERPACGRRTGRPSGRARGGRRASRRPSSRPACGRSRPPPPRCGCACANRRR